METNHELEVLLKTAAKVQVIEERFDRHFTQISEMISGSMDKIDRKFEVTDNKLDHLADRITNTHITSIEKHGATNAKIAGISGGIAVIMHFISSFISDIIKK